MAIQTFQLERVFQRKLNLAICSEAVHRADGAEACPEPGLTNRGRWIHKLRSIEDVKKLRAELQALAFLDPEILEQGEVKIHRTRPKQAIAAGVSPGEGRWRGVSRRID